MALYNEVILPMPYFGNSTFYACLLQKDVIVDVHEHYVKQSLRNRCELCGDQGRFILTAQVKGQHNAKIPLKDIQLSYSEDWPSDHRKAIRTAYGSSPFFIHYWDEIDSIWNERSDRLLDLNLKVHEVLCSILDIAPTLRLSEQYIESTPGQDLRPRFKTGISENPPYYQVFSDRNGFMKDLSILDLIFCLGPEALTYLQSTELQRS